VKELAPYWETMIHGLKGLPHVIDLRTIGLIAGIELDSRKGAVGERAMEVFDKAWDAGLLIRVTGDIIALSPPLIMERAHIDQMGEILAKILKPWRERT
jgi:beta-alanine--pyruvate transaminase